MMGVFSSPLHYDELFAPTNHKTLEQIRTEIIPEDVLDERNELSENMSDKFFTEYRTAKDAIVAEELAVNALRFLYRSDNSKFGWTQNEIFQYKLKSGAIAKKNQLDGMYEDINFKSQSVNISYYIWFILAISGMFLVIKKLKSSN